MSYEVRVERTKEASVHRVEEAKNDPDILTLKISEVMSKYRINYPNAKKAITEATQELYQGGDPAKRMAQIEKQKRVTRMRTHLLTAESKYPEILRRLNTSASMASIGDLYGIKGERARQIKKELKEFSEEMNKPLNTVIKLLEEDV